MVKKGEDWFENKKIDLLEYVPDKVKCGKNLNEYYINKNSDNYYLMLSYLTDMNIKFGQNVKREYFLTMPRYISCKPETFEVLGLLQAEMGKTNNGCITFANSDYNIINKVMKWFDKEIEIGNDKWRWYIKVNINNPNDMDYEQEVKEKVIQYWLNKTKTDPNKKYPTTVSYIKNTRNKKLGYHDYGTLIIERKSNLLSQIIKRYVNLLSYKVPSLNKEKIGWFMRGILAGESCVELYKYDKKYRVNISAVKNEERILYQKCLMRLGIPSKLYGNKQIMISKRENNVKLLKQKLMCLNHKKYNKFLNMMKCYPNISKETGYFTEKREPHNKIPKEKIDKILEIYYQYSDWPCWKISEKAGVSVIKVNRILRENDLGKRLIKTSETKREEIAKFADENPRLTQKQLAGKFQVTESVIRRVCQSYGIDRGNKARCKISKEKEKEIIEVYKKNPAVKFSEIRKEVEVSDYVIKRVRKENRLTHLGYKHLIGCNNPNYKNKD